MKNKILFVSTVLLATAVLCACNSESDQAHKHNLVKTDRIGATCTENGNIEYWQCSDCKKIFADSSADQELTDVVIPAAHTLGDEIYDYAKKIYVRACSACEFSATATAGSETHPLLARDEPELIEVIKNANPNDYIKLTNNITIYASDYGVLRLPDNGTLDLGGHTVTVKYNTGFLIEGTNVALQNGKVVTDFDNQALGYAVFIGDDGDDNSVVVKNIDSDGGFNVYNCRATFYNCNVNAIGRTYYALWADAHSTITVESGTYIGGGACIHSTANATPENCGNIILNGGSFQGNIYATYCTTINGGNIDGDVILTPYGNPPTNAKLIVNKNILDLNVILSPNHAENYSIVRSRDTDGNDVYETTLKQSAAE